MSVFPLSSEVLVGDTKTKIIDCQLGSAINRDVLGLFYVNIQHMDVLPVIYENFYVDIELTGSELGFKKHAAFSDAQLAYIAGELSTKGFVAFTVQGALYSTVRISAKCVGGSSANVRAEVGMMQAGSQIESVMDGGSANDVAQGGSSVTIPINANLAALNIEKSIDFTGSYRQLLIENTSLHVVYVKYGQSNLVGEMGKPLAACADNGGGVAVLGSGGCIVEEAWRGTIYIYSADPAGTAFVHAA